MSTDSQRTLWTSYLLLLAGLGWLALNFPHDSLWYDETVNAYLATSSWSTIWEWSTQIDNQPPLHFLLLKLWGTGAGTSEFSLRSFSLLCGVLSLAGVMRLSKQLSGTWLAGWLSAILLALSGSFLYAVFEVRTYALSFMLLVWATIFVVRLWRRPHPASLTRPARPTQMHASKSRFFLRDQIIYISLLIALVFSHYTGWFGVASHAVYIVWQLGQQRGRNWRLAGVTGLALVGTLASWLLALDGRDFNEGTAFAGDISTNTALETYWQFFVFGQKTVDDGARSLAMLWLGFVIVFGVAWLFWVARRNFSANLLAGSLVIIPLLGMILAVSLVEGKLSGRHTWVMWLGSLLIMAHGAAQIILQLQKLTKSQTLILSIMGLLFALPVYTTYQTYQLEDAVRGDFRTAFEILAEEAEPTDLLILRDGTLFTAVEYYDALINYVGLPNDKITNINHRVQTIEAQQIIESAIQDDTTAVWVLAWQGTNQDPLALGWAWGEYFSDGQAEVWLADGEADEPSQVSLIRYPMRRQTPLLDHVSSLPDVLKISSDGPGLVGYEIYPIFSTVNEPICMVVAHVWWWRGEVDYPDAMISLRVYDARQEVVVIGDQSLTGFTIGQADWLPNAPILGRVQVEGDCDKFVPDTSYDVELYIYSASDRFASQTIDADSFVAP